MYKAGITYEQFGKLNMKQIRIIANAYSEKIKDEFRTADTIAFIQGRYMIEALLCTVGNMLGKNAKFTYPDEPYSTRANNVELTEDEIEAQRQQFIAALKTMEANFNLNKENQKQIGE